MALLGERLRKEVQYGRLIRLLGANEHYTDERLRRDRFAVKRRPVFPLEDKNRWGIEG